MRADTLTLDEIVVFAVKRILATGEDCDFERLVQKCFALAPRKFGMRRFPQWPDSVRVNKSWLRCRSDKGWIAGTAREGFQLTPTGERAAEKASRRLGRGAHRASKQMATQPRDRVEAAVRQIRSTAAFTKYLAAPAAPVVSEMEIRHSLGGTMETPRRVLRQNLRFYLSSAEECRDDAVAAFLRYCASRMEPLARKVRRPS